MIGIGLSLWNLSQTSIVAALVNLLSSPDDLTNFIWQKTRVTVADNGDSSFRVTQVASQAFQGTIRQTVSASANSNVVISIEAKAGTTDWIFFREEQLDGSSNETFFNVSTGSIGASNADHNATIEDAGDGYYLCKITFQKDATVRSNLLQFYLAESDNTTSATGATYYVDMRDPVFAEV